MHLTFKPLIPDDRYHIIHNPHKYRNYRPAPIRGLGRPCAHHQDYMGKRTLIPQSRAESLRYSTGYPILGQTRCYAMSTSKHFSLAHPVGPLELLVGSSRAQPRNPRLGIQVNLRVERRAA